MAANGMAAGATGAGIDLFAGGGVAGDFLFAGGAGEGVDVGDEVPGLIVVEIRWRHAGAGNAFANGLKDRVIGEGMPEGALDEIRAAGAAAAVGTMTAGAGGGEEFGAGGDGFGLADGRVLRVIQVAAMLGGERQHGRQDDNREIDAH